MRLQYSIAVTLCFITCLSSFMLGLGQNDYVLPLMMFLAAITSLYVTDFRRWIRLGDWTVNVLVLIVVFCTIGDILAHRGEDMAVSIARVLVFVEMILLFREKDARFSWQILLISLLQVVVATVFQQSLFFGFLLLIYVFTGLCAFSLIFFQKENLYFRRHSFINSFFDTIRAEISERQDHRKLARIALVTLLTGPLSLIMSFTPTPSDTGFGKEGDAGDGPDSGEKKLSSRRMLRSLFAVFPEDHLVSGSGHWETVSVASESQAKTSWHESLWDETPAVSESSAGRNTTSASSVSAPQSKNKPHSDGTIPRKRLVPVPDADRDRFFRRKKNEPRVGRARFPLLSERPGFSAGTMAANGFEGGREELFSHLVRGTLFSLLFAIVFFWVVPRFGQMELWTFSFGHDGWQKSFTKPVGTVGFSERVRLGSLGSVLPYHREVLTVRMMKNLENRVLGSGESSNLETPYDEVLGSFLYFNGISLDYYERGTWTSSDINSQPLINNPFGVRNGRTAWTLPDIMSSIVSGDRPLGGASATRQTLPIPSGVVARPAETGKLYFEQGADLLNIYMLIQPLDSTVFFAPMPFYRSEDRDYPIINLYKNRSEELRLRKEPVSMLIFSTAFKKGTQLDVIPASYPIDIDSFLQMPEHGLDSLAELAKQWVAESNLPMNNVEGIARYLEKRFLYSEQYHYKLGGIVRDLRIDPLEDFIKRNPTGHCEYFAGALAMMLRSVGIASRVVVGFKIHPEQSHKDGFAIRQSDAHAWVEAFLPTNSIPERAQGKYEQFWQYGAWLRLDPTPSAEERTFLRSFTFSLTDLNQWIQNTWGDFVLNMNTSRQTEWIYQPIQQGFRLMVQKVFNANFWRSDLPNLIQNFKDYYARLRVGKSQAVLWVILMLPPLIGLILCYALWRLIRSLFGLMKRSSDAARQRRATIEFYARMERLLAGRGRERKQGETPLEYIRQVGFLPLTLPVVDAYYRVRYGAEQLSNDEFNAVRSALDQLETTIRHDAKKT